MSLGLFINGILAAAFGAWIALPQSVNFKMPCVLFKNGKRQKSALAPKAGCLATHSPLALAVWKMRGSMSQASWRNQKPQ
jgi:hypothetical protein